MSKEMTMQLSEAIMLGSFDKPQCFGFFNSALGGSCALGAAHDAVGAPDGSDTPFEDIIRRDKERWPVLRIGDRCPVCGVSTQLVHLVPHLNDDHRWSREKIADWVATKEREMAAKSRAEEESWWRSLITSGRGGAT